MTVSGDEDEILAEIVCQPPAQLVALGLPGLVGMVVILIAGAIRTHDGGWIDENLPGCVARGQGPLEPSFLGLTEHGLLRAVGRLIFVSEFADFGEPNFNKLSPSKSPVGLGANGRMSLEESDAVGEGDLTEGLGVGRGVVLQNVMVVLLPVGGNCGVEGDQPREFVESTPAIPSENERLCLKRAAVEIHGVARQYGEVGV